MRGWKAENEKEKRVSEYAVVCRDILRELFCIAENVKGKSRRK
jgi:hypothetical protein